MRSLNFCYGKQLLFSFSLSFFLFFFSCKKDVNNSSTVNRNTLSFDTTKYERTVHGKLILKSHHFLIEAGYGLTIQAGHVYKTEKASGKLIADFGEYQPFNAGGSKVLSNTSTPTISRKTLDAIEKKPTGQLYTNSTGWVAAEEWHNTGPNPINYFSATCTVPPLPTTQQDQTFAPWIGLSPATGGTGLAPGTSTIAQPIVSYGYNVYTYGGNYYQAFNVFDWGPDGDNEAYTVPQTVAPGTNVKFVIQYLGVNGGSYSYSSGLVNTATNATLSTNMNITINTQQLNNNGGYITLPTIPELNYADIVLEDPGQVGIASRSQYPNTTVQQSYFAMTNIVLSTGNPGVYNYPATLGWYPVPTSAPYGPHLNEIAVVQSAYNNYPAIPGQVNLWYACEVFPSIVGPYWYNPTETLSWAPVPGATEYEMVINSGPNGGGAFYYTTSTSIPNFFSTIEQNNTPGTYQVILMPIGPCGSGPSTYFTFNVCSNNLTAVGSPSWVNSTKTLSWGAVTGATEYEVIINTGPNGGGAFYETTATSIPNFFTTIEQNNTPGNYQVIIIPQYKCGNGPSTYFSFTNSN